MQIICISRGTFSGGKKLAESFSRNLGYDCLSREEISDAATRAGIPVGKLEMNVLRRRLLSERLVLERERFKAFVTATLCERALHAGLVYHGRTGHFVLPGIGHILRVRAIMDPEMRIERTMQRLSLDRDRARRYNHQVDEDRRRWVRILYNTDWVDPANFDLVLNLSHMNEENAAAALISMAQLPEFQATPATQRALEDSLLAAKCRLALGVDQRTFNMDAQVSAEQGVVSVTYLPRHQKQATHITAVLEKIEGIRELLCTMASTNILWVQERYDPKGESLGQLLELAGKWNAAVEMVRLTESKEELEQAALEGKTEQEELRAAEGTGGILDDAAEEGEVSLDESIKQTRDRLISAGHAGGYRVVAGGRKELLSSLDRSVNYSLVVVGDTFLSKGAAARKRLTREAVSYLSDNLRVPVITNDELKTQYLFGAGQWLRLLGFAAVAALLFFLVFTHQKEVLDFLSYKDASWRNVLKTAALFLFVPVFAYAYGHFAHYLLRLFRFH